MGTNPIAPIIEALLAGAFDYAGLFPPAALALPDAVARYDRYQRGPHAWMLGRFVIAAARLDDLAVALDHGGAGGRATAWAVSAVVGADAAADLEHVARFNAGQRQRWSWPARVDGIELKASGPAEVIRLAGQLLSPSAAWFELAPGPEPGLGAELGLRAGLREVAAVGAGAKLRTGGVTADAFPSSADVARFLIASAESDVRWKATAGLHHAMRGVHTLTYDRDSPRATMHGFLNVLLAAALVDRVVRDGASRSRADSLAEALLDEEAAEAFTWSGDAVAWRDYRFGVEEIAGVRTRYARSFGSCSFEEPVGALDALGLLDAAAAR